MLKSKNTSGHRTDSTESYEFMQYLTSRLRVESLPSGKRLYQVVNRVKRSVGISA